MSYPKNWPDLQAARNLWVPPDHLEVAFEDIRHTRLAYTFCITAFDLLRPEAETLDRDGLGIALGAAHIINRAQLDGRHEESLAFLIAYAARFDPPTDQP